jgi:hypothetical protein
MGSPISSTIAEINLQFLEEIYIKQWLGIKEIIHYKRYIDDILIIVDQNKVDGKTIVNHMNNTNKHLGFKEENSTLNYLDLSINRNTNSIHTEIYRKPTLTDVNVQFSSNHPIEHELAAFNFYINIMLTLPSQNKLNSKNGKLYLL